MKGLESTRCSAEVSVEAAAEGAAKGQGETTNRKRRWWVLPFVRSKQAHRGHPWWALCMALDCDQADLALLRLTKWEQQGIPQECIGAILGLSKSSGKTPSGLASSADHSQNNIQLHCFGINLVDWQAHAWLQRCALPTGYKLAETPEAGQVGLNLEALDYWLSHPKELLYLSTLDALWDPDPTRVAVFGALGIKAQILHTGLPCNGWLDRENDSHEAMLTLGLPHPHSLAVPDGVLLLGEAVAEMGEDHPHGLHEWPGFDRVQIADEESARLLAHWLEHCSRIGLQIVRIRPTPEELRCRGFESLSLSDDIAQTSCQYFHGALHLSVLRDELDWRREGRPIPTAIQTPMPQASVAWESKGKHSALVSVCISLYNYQDRIIKALESVGSQSQRQIELIIVDDASSDSGLEVTRKWLMLNHDKFCGCLLLRHRDNSGLAAARNSGFQAATADWCFVLDADNRLATQAVEQCLKLARDAPAEIAVIHPLIEQISEAVRSSSDARILGGGLSWQKQQFERGNYIDAMALVRRSAWQTVKGYSHIEDGWEDYDFWCKLIDHGYQGLLCPQVLATYVVHNQSMIHNRTNRNVRRISRVLQSRHPWLKLPMAQHDA